MATTTGYRDAIERQLVDSVSADRLMADTRKIAEWVRLSGSDEERQSFDYIEAQCRSIGAQIGRYAPECFVSLPGPATLTVVAPARVTVECITHAMAAPTTGLTGDVVYAGAGTYDEFVQANARGKIALTDGLSSPGKMKAAMDAGVAATISVSGENFNEMIVTPVWGSPTPETDHLVPTIPAITINNAGGATLKGYLDQGLRVAITAQVDTGWRPLPCLTAEIPGDDPDGHFVLFSGHVDSWHHGAMDNGSANATMLETLRVLATKPGGLRRGLRLAFWSGHSHARYATSTWYCDAFWSELKRACVAHVNVDSTGAIGATLLDEAETMAETTGLAADAIRLVAGQDLKYKRFGRAGDQSFWGPGLSSVFMSLSQQGAAQANASHFANLLGTNPGRSGGLGWWWHTVHDTIDKIDPANLARDTKVYVLVCNRLCADPVLGLDFGAAAREIATAINAYAAQANGHVDLGPAKTAAGQLVTAIEAAQSAIAGAKPGQARQINHALLSLGRVITPLSYSAVGRHEHDLALPLPTVPRLRDAAQIGQLDPNSHHYRLVRTRLTRAQNGVVDALNDAVAVANGLVAAIKSG